MTATEQLKRDMDMARRYLLEGIEHVEEMTRLLAASLTLLRDARDRWVIGAPKDFVDLSHAQKTFEAIWMVEQTVRAGLDQMALDFPPEPPKPTGPFD